MRSFCKNVPPSAPVWLSISRSYQQCGRMVSPHSPRGWHCQMVPAAQMMSSGVSLCFKTASPWALPLSSSAPALGGCCSHWVHLELSGTVLGCGVLRGSYKLLGKWQHTFPQSQSRLHCMQLQVSPAGTLLPLNCSAQGRLLFACYKVFAFSFHEFDDVTWWISLD